MHDTVFKAVAEPTIFMDVKFKRTVHYFATRKRAKSWARIYVIKHPAGAVDVYEKTRRGHAGRAER